MKLQSVEIPFDPVSWRDVAHSCEDQAKFQILGIAKVTCQNAQVNEGELMVWNQEGQLLHDMFLKPKDSIVLEVVDVARLRTPFEVSRRYFQGSEDTVHYKNRQRTV